MNMYTKDENHFHEIKKNILECIAKFPDNGKGISGTELTQKIKKTIGDLGIKKNFEVNASGNNGFQREWLFDLTWSRSNDKCFDSLELALESEQSANLEEVKYDFQKLLVTNAKMKIMFCLVPNKYDVSVDSIINMCEDSINNYTLLNKGSKIHLFIWEHYNSGQLIIKSIAKTT